MKNSFVQYLVGAVMLVFAAYQAYIQELWETALYVTAGLAFIVMGLMKDDIYPEHRKSLGIVSWILILLAVFLFLFLVRTDG